MAMQREVSYTVLSTDAAGIPADALGLNRPAGRDEHPHTVSCSVHEGSAHIDVVLVRGLCPTGGYRLEVLGVGVRDEGDGDEVIITVSLSDPGPGAIVTMMVNRPALVVRVRRQDVAVVRVQTEAGEVLDEIEVRS